GADQGREEDVLAALERIRRDPGEAEEARGRGADALPEELRVLEDRRRRRVERAEDRHAAPGPAPRRVEREIGGRAEPLDPPPVLTPGREALPQLLGRR